MTTHNIRVKRVNKTASPKQKQKKERPLIRKLEFLIFLAGILILTNIYFKEHILIVAGHIRFFFTALLLLSIQLFQIDEVVIGLILLALQILGYLVFFFVIKITIIDTLFPKIRIVTQNKDFHVIARKIKKTVGEDPHFVYLNVKFYLRPIFSWHVLKIPKPEYAYRGIPGINRKQYKVENGNKGVIWRRMPATQDIMTNDLHVNFNEEQNCYELGLKAYNYRPDPAEPYSQLTFDGVQEVGTNIIESVKGDYGLIKGQFNMGIVVRERPLPGTEIKKPKKPTEDL